MFLGASQPLRLILKEKLAQKFVLLSYHSKPVYLSSVEHKRRKSCAFSYNEG